MDASFQPCNDKSVRDRSILLSTGGFSLISVNNHRLKPASLPGQVLPIASGDGFPPQLKRVVLKLEEYTVNVFFYADIENINE